MDYNLVEWYCQNLIILKENSRKISRRVQLLTHFSQKRLFVNLCLAEGFHVISIRNDAGSVPILTFRSQPEREVIRSA